MNKLNNSHYGNINRLKNIMIKLRDPIKGCPWDIKQTYRTIAPHTVEEAYEVADAIERGDTNDLKEELGDLLLQVVYLSQIATEDTHFDFEDVVEAASSKMINRHPHMFNGDNTEIARPDWEGLKEKERKIKNPVSSVLEGVAITLPALIRAFKLQKRAARVGFDWPDHKGAFEKLTEEINELKVEIEAPNRAIAKLKDELGDVLFSVINLARKLELDPEECLKGGNFKFKTRFEEIEQILKINKKTFDDVSLDDLEKLWRKAKEKEMTVIN